MVRKYGLIGEKLGHSYSKLIHEQLADYSYDLIPLSKEEFPSFMEQRNFAGINVTIPYKQAVLPYLDKIDPAAQKIGAVNTIVNRDGKLFGYNTDYLGFLDTLQRNQIEIQKKKVLVLGNGGAAKAVNAAIASLSPRSQITVKYKEEPNTVTYEQAAALHADADVMINTSPVGMYPKVNDCPIDLTPYQKLSAVVDIIYNPAVTVFLQQAKDRNIKAVNGLWMLLAQAKYAAELFTGHSISDEKIEKLSQSPDFTSLH